MGHHDKDKYKPVGVEKKFDLTMRCNVVGREPA